MTCKHRWHFVEKGWKTDMTNGDAYAAYEFVCDRCGKVKIKKWRK